jgi:hypothetical protein
LSFQIGLDLKPRSVIEAQTAAGISASLAAVSCVESQGIVSMDGEQGPGSDPCSRDDLFALPHVSCGDAALVVGVTQHQHVRTTRPAMQHMTGVYSRNSTFLADDEYGRALDTLVKGRSKAGGCMQGRDGGGRTSNLKLALASLSCLQVVQM